MSPPRPFAAPWRANTALLGGVLAVVVVVVRVVAGEDKTRSTDWPRHLTCRPLASMTPEPFPTTCLLLSWMDGWMVGGDASTECGYPSATLARHSWRLLLSSGVSSQPASQPAIRSLEVLIPAHSSRWTAAAHRIAHQHRVIWGRVDDELDEAISTVIRATRRWLTSGDGPAWAGSRGLGLLLVHYSWFNPMDGWILGRCNEGPQRRPLNAPRAPGYLAQAPVEAPGLSPWDVVSRGHFPTWQ
ncbi:hypothetical protein PCL_05748 [Purpureocillium lilacinum]|uniref:Uncharacterized protein n=1 Tax=Purpureocillium lilacinum TaxID=33203 RepID=A0A2U3EKW8_PURLI|nr:hypothetical protein PCL_05748 [Purpureocillium lilacinum]